MIDAVRSFLAEGSNSNLVPLAQNCYICVHNFLSRAFPNWSQIVRLGEVCINQGLRLLNTVKDPIVNVIMQNYEISKALTQIATKSGTTLVAKYAAKKIAAKSTTHTIVAQSVKKGGVSVTKVAVTQGAKQGVKQGVKAAVKAANVIGVAADVTQAGLEYCGYESAGKKVGIAGNVVSGAIFGATVGGPPGAAVGLFLGFMIWGAGEVVGNYFDRAFQS